MHVDKIKNKIEFMSVSNYFFPKKKIDFFSLSNIIFQNKTIIQQRFAKLATYL
jgi:hypothetical protein